MFNQIGYNRIPFNRPFTLNVYGSFTLDGDGETTVLANVTASPGFDLEGAAEAVIQAVRYRLGSFILDGVGELESQAVRERYGAFDLEAAGEISVEASRYHVDSITFTGSFAPGDRVVIDSKMLTLTKNSQNALESMSGDFFGLNLGDNEIKYTDDVTGRSVLVRITYRDKFV